MKTLRNSHAFTLLEVMIAMAIMIVAFASIMVVQSSSLGTSAKAKQMNVVGMLARNAMTQTEVEILGKPFSEIEAEKSGQFEEPFQDYTWERKVKEVEFPNISALFQKASEGEDKRPDDPNANADMQEQFGKLVFNYLSKAIREVSITIRWKKGKGEQNYSIAMYWVNFDAPLQLTP